MPGARREVRKTVEVKKVMLHKAAINEQTIHATIGPAQFITFIAEFESLVVFLMFICGPLKLEGIQTAKPTQRILPAPGILEVFKEVPFSPMQTKVSKKCALLHKHMCIAMVAWPPEIKLITEEDGDSKLTAVPNTVPCKEVQDLHTQISRCLKLEKGDVEPKWHDCRNKAWIDAKFHAHCNNFIDTITKILSMLDGSVCHLSFTTLNRYQTRRKPYTGSRTEQVQGHVGFK